MRQVRFRAVTASAVGLFVAAALALTGSPASAADPGFIFAQFQESSTSLPAHAASARTVHASVFATGPYTNGVVAFDFSGLTGVATASLPAAAGCTVAGSTASCAIPSISDTSGQEFDFTITVTSTAAAANAATGSMSVSVSADGADVEGPADASVTIVDAPELDSQSELPDQNVNLGAAVSMPLELANLGSKPAPGVEVVFDVSHGVAPATYDNCLYGPWAADLGTFVACTIPGAIAVGQQVKLHGGLNGTIVADSAAIARVDGEFMTTSATTPVPPTGGDWQGVTFTARPPSGHSLTFDTEPTTIAPGDPFAETWVYRVNTTIDVAAIGANLTGHVGDTVNATLGITDLGPASIDNFSSHNDAQYFVFTVPTWATAVTVPSNCQGMDVLFNSPVAGAPGKKYYECAKPDTYVMSVGETFSATIGLKITSLAGVNGQVAIFENAMASDDLNNANNIAPVTLTGAAISGDTFSPLPPTRILDTRSGLGAPKARVGAGGVVTLQVAGVGGVPASGVTAVVMNVTAVSPTATSYITVYPDGQAAPTVSNINVAAGQTLPNLVTVPVVNGKVDLRNNAGTVDLLADITGYYTGAGTGSALNTAGPVRILDTRSGLGTPKARVGAGGVVTLQVAGVGGVPASGVTAVVMNVTAVSPTATSFITVYPDGQAVPNVSNLNLVAGQTVANLVIVPVVNGKVDLRNQAGTVDLLADVTGYFASGGSGFHTAGPVRVMDTRSGVGVAKGVVGPGGTVTLSVVGANGLPATGVTVVVLNVTATQGTASSYLTVYPDGQPVPTASNVNFTAGETIANLVIVPVVNGKVDFRNASGNVQIIGDLAGYFTN